MVNKAFIHNDPDDYHDSKLTLHDCIADKISFKNNVLSFNFSDGFWITPEHEVTSLSNTVRTDGAQVDFEIKPDEFFEIYLDVFRKRRFCKKTVEYWELDELIKAFDSGKYQLEFIYQYRTHFEQMWQCMLHYKGCWYAECQLHIPYCTATYRWNNLR